MVNTSHFYRDLPVLERFSDAMQTRLHAALPNDWWIVIADVADSTKAIDAGNYKKVNTVGVACIAAVVNVDRSVEIPFVFGGDGATFAVPNTNLDQVKAALRGAQQLSRESFNLDLRVGLVKVGDFLAQDFQVKVAKVRVSAHVNQASFSGHGWEEAERRVKASVVNGVHLVREIDGPIEADFSGFECRWHSVRQFNGHKLSLLVAATSDDLATNLDTYQSVIHQIHAIYGDEKEYHPLRPSVMRLTLNPRLLSHEWRVRSSRKSISEKLRYFLSMMFKNVAGWYLFARNLDTEAVSWSRYRDELVENTDYQKFDGILRMVIDGSESQAEQLKNFLESKFRAGSLAYGMHKSREALVTCLVQSFSGNHLHFVDGSDGGYAIAARGLKQQLKSLKA